MFDLGWDEMALIGVVTLIVMGPKDLPKVLRQAGRWARRVREMAHQFQHGLDQMVQEAELDEVRKDVERAGDASDFQREVEQAMTLHDSPPVVVPPPVATVAEAQTVAPPSIPPAP